MSTYEISKSSLLSLKAEILKKQEELNKAKLENKVKVQKVVKKGPLEFKNKGVENRRALDVNSDDEDLHRKSRKALEEKTKLYDKLTKATHDPGDIDENRKYLVQFSKKSQDETNAASHLDDEDDVDKYPESDPEEPGDYDDYTAENSDDEWVEYTDCFGRTRTCLRKDLKAMKEKEKDIRPELDKNDDEDDDKRELSEERAPTECGDFDEGSEMLSGDMRRELLRQQWEKEENELRDKKNIHYQDVLFKEARSHGVGYYAFSKDEEVREKQQEALNKLRRETNEQQKMAQEVKKNRERQLKARILAAKNRKRARMGLPPLEVDDEPDEPVEKVEEEPKKEPPVEDLEKEREKNAARKRHIRPWDIGKEGVKEHVEYTQEEWVQIQRKKREGEFAPPRSYNSTTNDIPEPSQSKGLYFSSKKSRQEDFVVDTSRPPPKIRNPARRSVNPYKPQNVSESEGEEDRLLRDYRNAGNSGFAQTPIVDECIDDDDEDRLMKDYKTTQSSVNPYKSADFTRMPIEDESVDEHDEEEDDRLMQDYQNSEHKRGAGVEVAPPPTYEYYGPSGSKPRKNIKNVNSMEDSIMEGLKFLRDKVEEKKSKKRIK